MADHLVDAASRVAVVSPNAMRSGDAPIETRDARAVGTGTCVHGVAAASVRVEPVDDVDRATF
jgi:hypothetical protein